MNASRSAHLLTAAAKVNWTLTRFRTPLFVAGHSLRVRTTCRHSPRTQRYGMMQDFVSADPGNRVAVVKPPLRLRPRRGRSLLTPDERSVIWGGECSRLPLSRRGCRLLRSITPAAAKGCRFSKGMGTLHRAGDGEHDGVH